MLDVGAAGRSTATTVPRATTAAMSACSVGVSATQLHATARGACCQLTTSVVASIATTTRSALILIPPGCHRDPAGSSPRR